MAKRVFKDVKTFKVVRKDWLRGTANSSLLDEKNKMCCLGFYALACGVPKKHILNEGTPEDLCERLVTVNAKWKSFLINEDVDPDVVGTCDGNSKDADDLMITNDNWKISDKMREYLLKRKFAKNGIKVIFTGKS